MFPEVSCPPAPFLLLTSMPFPPIFITSFLASAYPLPLSPSSVLLISAPSPWFSHSCCCLLSPILSHSCAHACPPFPHPPVCSHSPRCLILLDTCIYPRPLALIPLTLAGCSGYSDELSPHSCPLFSLSDPLPVAAGSLWAPFPGSSSLPILSRGPPAWPSHSPRPDEARPLFHSHAHALTLRTAHAPSPSPSRWLAGSLGSSSHF